MKKIAIFLVVTAWLTGCATDDWSWYKANSSDQDFNQDAGFCRAQAYSVPGAQSFQMANVYMGCLNGKGWEKRNNR